MALVRILQKYDVGEVPADLFATVVRSSVRGLSRRPAIVADIEVAESDIVDVPGQ